MVGEGDAPDEEPGHQLGQVADEDKQGPGTAAAHGLHGAGGHRQQAAPAHHRVDEGGEAGGVPRHIVVHIVQDGPDVKEPLVPAGGVGVGVGDAAVVGEHILLVLPHGADEAGEAGVPLRHGVGQVGQGVDGRRDDGEHQHGKAEDLEDPLHPAGLLRRPVPHLLVQADEVEHHQPGAAVDHRPLGGRPDAPEQPRQEQGQGALPEGGARRQGQVAVHKPVHQQNEEKRVGVDGGQPGLGQVHEVRRQQDGAAGGDGGAAKQVFQEHVQQGQHPHPEQGAHEPPAEGGHAEEADADAHDQLAQGRVGDLIGLDATDVLPGGAGVVDLVKIGLVVVGGLVRHHVLLVKQGADRAGHLHPVPRHVEQGHLPQLQQALVGLPGDAQVADILGVLKGELVPLEELVVVLGHGKALAVAGGVGPVIDGLLAVGLIRLRPAPQGEPGHPVPGDLHLVLSCAQVGVIPQLGHLHRLGQGEGGRLPAAEVPGALGRPEGAQVGEGGDGIHGGDEEDGNGVPPHQGMASAGEGEAGLLPGRLLGRRDQALGQGGALGAPVPVEEGEQRQQGGDGKEIDQIVDGIHRRSPLGNPKNRRTGIRSSFYFISSSSFCQRKILRCPPDWVESRPWLRHRHAAPPSARGSGWWEPEPSR